MLRRLTARARAAAGNSLCVAGVHGPAACLMSAAPTVAEVCAMWNGVKPDPARPSIVAGWWRHIGHRCHDWPSSPPPLRSAPSPRSIPSTSDSSTRSHIAARCSAPQSSSQSSRSISARSNIGRRERGRRSLVGEIVSSAGTAHLAKPPATALARPGPVS